MICSFCESYEIHKLAEDKNGDFRYVYNVALVSFTKYKNSRESRSVDFISKGKGSPLNFCPECGRKINKI